MAINSTKSPGADVSISGTDDLTVINAIKQYKEEAQGARKDRIRQNKVNRLAYMGKQNWDHKQKGQSKEFLPKTAVAVEQFVGFAKRAMTQFGDYYDPVLGNESNSPLSVHQIRALMECHLTNLVVENGKMGTFTTQLTDGLKSGTLESLIILKVFGNKKKERKFTVEAGQPFINPETDTFEISEDVLKTSEAEIWRLRIDLIRQEDYYPDPSGRGLYEIHSTEQDLHYLQERADEGIYDKAAVSAIEEDFRKEESQKRRPNSLGQNESIKPSFRKKVVIDEFWGTILGSDGRVTKRNVFATVVNGKHLVRRPIANPFWHQESPFIAVPLIRVPFSVWHKALMDSAVQLNIAQNELFNLMVDGALSSVWGIKQLRIDELEDPSQVAGGISQGDTLIVRGSLPHGQKVLEKVVEGEVPPASMAIFELINREFVTSALSNELKLGSLPAKEVRATEIVELSQSQAVTLDSIIGDVEHDLIAVTLRKAWLTILQNLDDVSGEETISAIGLEAAFKLSQMTPAERFATFANVCSFKVHGLSAVLAKVRDFQKLMALLQAVGSNPIMLQAFFKKYSPNKVLSHLIKSLSINPLNMERDEEELAKLDEDIQGLQQFQGIMNGGGGSQPAPASPDESVVPAEVSQISNPATGMV